MDTREDLIETGEADGGHLKELDEKLKTRIENLKDMVLYRFGSTGVVQVLSRASELLGLVPVFPVRNIHSFGSGSAGSNVVFRDCVLVKRGTTVKECARKVMGDATLAYVEGTGNIRVSEDEVISVGKHDVSRDCATVTAGSVLTHPNTDSFVQGRPIMRSEHRLRDIVFNTRTPVIRKAKIYEQATIAKSCHSSTWI